MYSILIADDAMMVCSCVTTQLTQSTQRQSWTLRTSMAIPVACTTLMHATKMPLPSTEFTGDLTICTNINVVRANLTAAKAHMLFRGVRCLSAKMAAIAHNLHRTGTNIMLAIGTTLVAMMLFSAVGSAVAKLAGLIAPRAFLHGVLSDCVATLATMLLSAVIGALTKLARLIAPRTLADIMITNGAATVAAMLLRSMSSAIAELASLLTLRTLTDVMIAISTANVTVMLLRSVTHAVAELASLLALGASSDIMLTNGFANWAAMLCGSV